MAARGKKKSKKSSSGVMEAIGSPGARRVAVGVLAAFAVGGAAWGAVIGVDRLDQRADDILRTGAPTIVFDWPQASGAETSWLPQSERLRLDRLALDALTPKWSALSSDGLGDVGYALEATGWFETTPTVRRDGAERVVIDATWRTPAGVVRREGARYLISADGRLLPLVYSDGARLSLRPVLVGVHDPLPSDARGRLMFGEVWSEAPILSGLALGNLLRRESFFDQIDAIDVSRIDTAGEGALEIVTTTGGRLVWGSRPGAFTPGEVPDETKLNHLRFIAERYTMIDAGRDRLEIFGQTVVIDQRALPGVPSGGNTGP